MERMSSAESVVTKPVDFITEFTPAKDARLVSTFTLFPNTRLCSSFHDFIDVCQLKEYSRKMHLKSGMCGTRREESMNEDRPWTHSSLHPTVYWPWKGCWTAALLRRRRRRRSSGRRREREKRAEPDFASSFFPKQASKQECALLCQAIWLRKRIRTQVCLSCCNMRDQEVFRHVYWSNWLNCFWWHKGNERKYFNRKHEEIDRMIWLKGCYKHWSSEKVLKEKVTCIEIVLPCKSYKCLQCDNS